MRRYKRYRDGQSPVVSELWKQKTGLDWSEAKNKGYTTGSYSDNISLMKKLNQEDFSLDTLPTLQQESTIDDSIEMPSNLSFSQAFAQARKDKGAGSLFSWKGKEYRAVVEGELLDGTPNPVENNLNSTVKKTPTEQAVSLIGDVDQVTSVASSPYTIKEGHPIDERKEYLTKDPRTGKQLQYTSASKCYLSDMFPDKVSEIYETASWSASPDGGFVKAIMAKNPELSKQQAVRVAERHAADNVHGAWDNAGLILASGGSEIWSTRSRPNEGWYDVSSSKDNLEFDPINDSKNLSIGDVMYFYMPNKRHKDELKGLNQNLFKSAVNRGIRHTGTVTGFDENGEAIVSHKYGKGQHYDSKVSELTGEQFGYKVGNVVRPKFVQETAEKEAKYNASPYNEEELGVKFSGDLIGTPKVKAASDFYKTNRALIGKYLDLEPNIMDGLYKRAMGMAAQETGFGGELYPEQTGKAHFYSAKYGGKQAAADALGDDASAYLKGRVTGEEGTTTEPLWKQEIRLANEAKEQGLSKEEADKYIKDNMKPLAKGRNAIVPSLGPWQIKEIPVGASNLYKHLQNPQSYNEEAEGIDREGLVDGITFGGKDATTKGLTTILYRMADEYKSLKARNNTLPESERLTDTELMNQALVVQNQISAREPEYAKFYFRGNDFNKRSHYFDKANKGWNVIHYGLPEDFSNTNELPKYSFEGEASQAIEEAKQEQETYKEDVKAGRVITVGQKVEKKEEKKEEKVPEQVMEELTEEEKENLINYLRNL